MTHESEKSYTDRVEECLIDEYGEDNVEREHYLEESGRYADFKVDTPVTTLLIEAENDFEAAFKGVGQALLYAAHYEDASPVVILPPEHIKEPEAEMLSRHVPIVELDV